MIISRLRFGDIGEPLKGREIDLDLSGLGAGVYAFVGPNGSGKTTALELLLPGTLYRTFPSYRESFIEKAVGRSAFAELTFRLSEELQHRVLVKADPQAGGGRGKTEAYWFTRADTEPETAVAGPNLRDFDAVVGANLPSLELLLAGPYCAQRVNHANGSLLSAPRADRRALFAEALVLQRWQEISDQAKARRQLAAEEARRALGRIEELKQEQARGFAPTVALAGLRSDLERATALRVIDRDALTQAQQEYAEMHAVWNATAAKQKARVDVAARLERISAHISEAGGRLKAAVAVQQHEAERQRLTTAVAQCEAELAESDQMIEGLEASAAALRGLLDQDRSELHARQAELQAQVSVIEEVQPLLDGMAGVNLSLALCQACPLTAVARAAEPRAAVAKSHLGPSSIQVEQQRAVVAGRAASMVKASETYTAGKEQRDQVAQHLSLVKRALAKLPPYNAALVAQLEGQLAALVTEEETADRELASLPSVLEIPTHPDVGVRRVHEAQTVLAKAEDEVTRLTRSVAEAEASSARHAEVTAELTRWQAVARDQATATDGWGLLERSCGATGIQAVFLDQAAPRVQQLANDLLHEGFGRRFSIALETIRDKKTGGEQETFDVRLIDSLSGRQGSQGSGGETVWIDTALRLGFSIYVTETSGRPMRTLCLDEAAGALSAGFASAYMRMLHAARALGHFHHVFAVSHQRECWGGANGFFVFGGEQVRYSTDLEDLS